MKLRNVVKHCGNFSPQMLSGMIGYGREADGDQENGYVSKEGDIQLGGFLYRQAVQRAANLGSKFHALDPRAQEKLACGLAREHFNQFGSAGQEHYKHWLIRVKVFADKRGIELPDELPGESNHVYSRRVRKWISARSEKWPERRDAAGMHIVFSPDPKVWESFRAAGLDDRLVLRSILTQTMKEFSDWRRKEHGKNSSLGWVAGTHVIAKGAEKHPHIHLVILKRDEFGNEVDLSTSTLKGKAATTNSPDPLRELKRLFAKNVFKELEKVIPKEVGQSKPWQTFPRLKRFSKALRTIHRITQISSSPRSYQVGPLMRAIAMTSARLQSELTAERD